MLYRNRLYAAPTLERLRAGARIVHTGTERELLQHWTFATPR